VAVGVAGELIGVALAACMRPASIHRARGNQRPAPTLTMALQAGVPWKALLEASLCRSPAPKRVGALMLPSPSLRLAEAFLLVCLIARFRDASGSALGKILAIVAENRGGAAASAALLTGSYQPKPGGARAEFSSAGATLSR